MCGFVPALTQTSNFHTKSSMQWLRYQTAHLPHCRVFIDRQHKILQYFYDNLTQTQMTSSRTRKFVYDKQLAEEGSTRIRLINVLPGYRGTKLRSELRYVSLDKVPEYDAISYYWGDEEPSVEVDCDGRSLLVRPNLAGALSHFRDKDEPTYLWADAMCINQDDNDEKNVQVGLMRKIYRQAHTVKIWLGEDSEGDATEAFGLVKMLANARNHLGSEATHISLESPRLGRYGIPQIADPIWQKLLRLLERQWFYRVWIIQEVAVSRRAVVYWGSANISWEDRSAGIDLAITTGATRILSGMTSSGFSSIRSTLVLAQLMMTQNRILEKGSDSLDLGFLLLNHRGAQASRLKDKVYALLGLSNKINGRVVRIKTNYELATSEVYTKVAKEILEASDTLDILSISKVRTNVPIGKRSLAARRADPSPVPGLPSWVPDWSVPATGGEICFKGHGGSYFWVFNAARNQKTPKVVGFNGIILELSGFAFDRISEVGEVMQSDSIAPSADMSPEEQVMADLHAKLAIYDGWRRIAQCDSALPYPTGEDRYDAYVKTLFLDKLPPGESLENAKEFEMDGHRFYQRSNENNPLVNIFSALFGFSVGAMPYRAGAHKALAGCRTACTDMRRMIRTRDGYIGLAAPMVEHGDGVVLVKGGRMPLILRKTGRNLTLIGDCYIHGIMQGEAFNERLCAPVRIE